MGRGIIDYLVRASMDARITSDGIGVLTLGTGSCLDRRRWLFLQKTGHTVGTSCLCYMMNIGAWHHKNLLCDNVGMGAATNGVGSLLVTAIER